jgi:soluble lytic murein transglycosylase-like protein
MRADAIPTSVPVTNVTGAIRQASRLTGASFDYLLATAQVESGFNPNSAASTSSARGLFQFIEQTWLAKPSRPCAKPMAASSAAARVSSAA